MEEKGSSIPRNRGRPIFEIDSQWHAWVLLISYLLSLHEMNVIHRDLKLPNILILNNTLKIGDLGFAKRLDDKEALVKDALGTLGTMAPEVIEFKPYGMLADMFSLGAIYYQMLFGVLPFSIKSYDDFLKDVRSCTLYSSIFSGS